MGEKAVLPSRVAVLGMGRWGRTWCRVLEREPQVAIAAVAIRPGAAPIGFPGTRVLDDLQSALEVEGLDAAVVTLPIGLHLDAIRLAADRRLPVLCEKPAVSTRSDLAELVDLGDTDGFVVRINQNYRLRPWVAAVREHLPDIGPLQNVEVGFAQPEFPDGGRDRLAHPLLADMAIHHIDLVRHITGREPTVRRANATRRPGSTYLGATDLDVLLALSDGAEVAYAGTWAAREVATPWDGNWTFHGASGTLTVRNLAVDLDTGDGPHRVASTYSPVEDDDLSQAWHEFARATNGDTSAGVTVSDNARSLALIFDIAEAAGISDPWAIVAPAR